MTSRIRKRITGKRRAASIASSCRMGESRSSATLLTTRDTALMCSTRVPLLSTSPISIPPPYMSTQPQPLTPMPTTAPSTTLILPLLRTSSQRNISTFSNSQHILRPPHLTRNKHTRRPLPPTRKTTRTLPPLLRTLSTDMKRVTLQGSDTTSCRTTVTTRLPRPTPPHLFLNPTLPPRPL